MTLSMLSKVKEIILSFYLEVKNTFSKLHPLFGVWNSVVKATLCQSQHLKQRHSKHTYNINFTVTYPK